MTIIGLIAGFMMMGYGAWLIHPGLPIMMVGYIILHSAVFGYTNMKGDKS